MLCQRFPTSVLKEALLPHEQWHPFPTAKDHKPWLALPGVVRNTLAGAAKAARGSEWPPLPATRFLDYVRDGNRTRYERLSFGRREILAHLVLGECILGAGRCVDDIVDGVWAICEESFWGVPAHVGAQRAGAGLPDVNEPIVDLFAAETGALLAWTLYLVGPRLDDVSPLLCDRIRQEITRRLLEPLRTREDFGWMGYDGQRVNNWNPWINSNWLTVALLVETDETRRREAVAKSMACLDHFIDRYPADGGCDEGPGYWTRAGASLFDCLELLYSATDGVVDVYDDPLIAEIGRFIWRVQIADDYFVNFADASPVVRPPAAVVYGYGKRVNDTPLMQLGAWLAQASADAVTGGRSSLGRVLPALFTFPEMTGAPAAMPLPRDVWLPTVEVMVARDVEARPDGLFLAAKGGNNAESHNHNDVGNFIVYSDGAPLLVDAGVESYTAKTFSGKRYELWTMQSAYHSLLPVVDGVGQRAGPEYAARYAGWEADTVHATLSLDLAGAYPPEAALRRWQRRVTLQRGLEVRIQDEYELARSAAAIELCLLTPSDVTHRRRGTGLRLKPTDLARGRSSGAGLLLWDAPDITCDLETIPLTDGRLAGVWGETLTRIVFRISHPPATGKLEFRILPGR